MSDTDGLIYALTAERDAALAQVATLSAERDTWRQRAERAEKERDQAITAHIKITAATVRWDVPVSSTSSSPPPPPFKDRADLPPVADERTTDD